MLRLLFLIYCVTLSFSRVSVVGVVLGMGVEGGVREWGGGWERWGMGYSLPVLGGMGATA